MAELDYDKMSDEDFENLLDNIDDVDAVDADEDTEDFEDTDQTDYDPDSEEEETETNQDDDDDFDDTDDDSEEEGEDSGEENTQDIEDDGEEADDESGSEDDDEDESADEEGEDEETQAAPEDMTNQDKIDYQKAYEEALAQKTQYEDFYNQVTSEFVANGKTMHGPKDPKKIVQAMQKAVGFDDKMKSFKKYRKFITPLDEKGVLDDPDKFNLMMSAMDGDSEAIKKIIQNAEIDPIELDMDNINYTPSSSVSSDIELAYDDVLESAQQNGVREQVQKVVNGDWDQQSVLELLEDPENSADLVSHLSTGVYDIVQERIAQKKMTDANGTYGAKKSIEQYREAAKELEYEYKLFLQQQEAAGVVPEQAEPSQDNGYGEQDSQFTESEIQEEIERIKEERAYKAKVGKRNSEAAEGRKKAASLSKKKPRSKKKNTTFDPGKLSDDEFSEYLDSMIFE